MTLLPPELWARIASFARREDLSELALVSSLHRDIAQREQDKEIVLETALPGELKPVQIVGLLVRRGRARNVRSLSLQDKTTICHHLYMVLRSFPNLRSLSMNQFGASAATQRMLVSVLETHCPCLEQFVLSTEFHPHAPSRYFPVPNLTSVRWNESGRISPAFLSLCRASLTTLRDVQIVMTTERISRYVEFFGLRFPTLEALQLGPGPRYLSMDDSKDARDALVSAFIKFLVAHPGITYLRLVHTGPAWGDPEDSESYIPISLQKSSSEAMNILPKLVRLRAHPNQVAGFANAGALFFTKSLRSLYIASTRRELSSEISRMLRSLVKYTAKHGPSRNVQELTFTDAFKHSINIHDNLRPHFERIAIIFPSLKLWKGPVPTKAKAHELARVYSKLPCIRTLAIQTSTDREIRDKDIAVIAKECPTLEEVICDRVDCGSVYHIGRKPSGQIDIQVQEMDLEDDRFHSDDERVLDPDGDSDDDDEREDLDREGSIDSDGLSESE